MRAKSIILVLMLLSGKPLFAVGYQQEIECQQGLARASHPLGVSHPFDIGRNEEHRSRAALKLLPREQAFIVFNAGNDYRCPLIGVANAPNHFDQQVSLGPEGTFFVRGEVRSEHSLFVVYHETNTLQVPEATRARYPRSTCTPGNGRYRSHLIEELVTNSYSLAQVFENTANHGLQNREGRVSPSTLARFRQALEVCTRIESFRTGFDNALREGLNRRANITNFGQAQNTVEYLQRSQQALDLLTQLERAYPTYDPTNGTPRCGQQSSAANRGCDRR